MKKIKYIASTLFAILLMFSCYEDKGNYDYTHKYGIEISSIKEEYSAISMQSKVEIQPTIKTETPEEELDYLWTLFNPNENSGAQAAVIDTIGYEKNLSYEVVKSTGNYVIVLKVKNRKNDYTQSHSTKLSVVTEFSRGFYVLKENAAGNTDMDLHLNDSTKMENLLTKSLGAAVNGAPTRLGLYFQYCFPNNVTGKIETSNALAVMTKEDIKIMNVSNMRLIYDHDNMFYSEEAPAEQPHYVCNLFFGIAYLSSNGLYFNKQYSENNVTSTGKYGMTSDISDGHSASNFAIQDTQTFTFFDEKNKRFLSGDSKGVLHILSNGGNENKPNNIEHKFIYMGLSINKDAFAIFEDRTTPSKHYLYQMNINNIANTGYPNPIQSVETIASSLKLNSGKLFATDRLLAKMIYFVSDNKLYVYDTGNKSETQLIPKEIGGDEQITHLSNKYWIQSDDKEHNFNYLVIGTQKVGNYNIYMYETVGGQINGAPKTTIHGVGKMVDFHYVSPKMKSRTSISNYSQI